MDIGDAGRLSSDPAERPSHLRLVWSNPHPPLPHRPVDLAVAIERHLSGRYGISDEEFALVFARAAAPEGRRML